MLQPLVTKLRRRAAEIPLGRALTLALAAALASGVSDGRGAPVVKLHAFVPAFIGTEIQPLGDDAPGAAATVARRAPRVIVVQDGEMLDAPASALAPSKLAAKPAAPATRLRAKRLAEGRSADSAVRVTVVGPDGKVQTRILRIRR